MPSDRIGIYSGTFNPVHSGHMAFALQAMQAGKLDSLYFLPERRPRNKKQVEHFGHRVAMLQRAVRPYPKFNVLELDDVSFSIRRTLPNLEKLFKGSELIYLVGSDAVLNMAEWPYIERLFSTTELIVGMRDGQTTEQVKKLIASWPKPPIVTLIDSHAPDVSSSSVRAALETRQSTKGLLKSVAQYSNHNCLYISLAENNS